MNQSVVVSFPLAIHELSWVRSVCLDWCDQEMQRQTECGLTRVSLLMQGGDVTKRKGKEEKEMG